jgi:hypothetical protein
MSNQDKLLDQISQLQEQYYEENAKTHNFLYKNKQKIECATAISSQFNLEQLLNHTSYIIPNTNKVFFDYTVFKTYATPELYKTIVDWTTNLFEICIQQYGNYEAHINLLSLTITATDRYKQVFPILVQNSLVRQNKYAHLLTHFYMYNPPNVFDTIIKICSPFIDSTVRQKIILISKSESDERLRELFSVNL